MPALTGVARLALWSEWRDSNPRPLVPQTSALTGLRYTPMTALIEKAQRRRNAQRRPGHWLNGFRSHAARCRAAGCRGLGPPRRPEDVVALGELRQGRPQPSDIVIKNRRHLLVLSCLLGGETARVRYTQRSS